jgi:hypothetical protein
MRFFPWFFALLALLLFPFPAFAQETVRTEINGEAFTPSREQCLAALENGRFVPSKRHEASWAASGYFYHRGNVYPIIINSKTIVCAGWRL